jgi:small-conductance mechanosensitive channel
MDGITGQAGDAVSSAGGWLLQLLPHNLRTPLAEQVLTALIGLLVLWLCVALARSATTRYVQDAESRYKMRKILGFAGILLGVLYLAGVFSQNLRNLTIALGVAGAALALAMRGVAIGVASWVAITFGGYFRVGDRVAVSGITGDVIDIGLTRVTLMECGNWVKGDQYSGRIVRIPNGTILEGPIFNYSQDFPFVWDDLGVPILYGSDMEAACALALEVAREHVGDYAKGASHGWERVTKRYAIEDAAVAPMVFLHARDEGWAELTLRYVVDYKARRRTKTELYRAIYAAIDATDGQVRLAASQLEVVGAPELSVRIAEREGG